MQGRVLVDIILDSGLLPATAQPVEGLVGEEDGVLGVVHGEEERGSGGADALELGEGPDCAPGVV